SRTAKTRGTWKSWSAAAPSCNRSIASPTMSRRSSRRCGGRAGRVRRPRATLLARLGQRGGRSIARIEGTVPSLSGRHFHAAVNRRTRADRVEPAFDVGEFPQIDLVPFVARDPRISRDVGDRVIAGEIVDLAQPRVHHAVKPPRLLGVALGTVGIG